MKKTYKQSILISVSLASLVALAACDTLTGIKTAITGERADEQTMLGPRRMPVQNTPGAALDHTASAAAAPYAPVASMPAPAAPLPMVSSAPSAMATSPAPHRMESPETDPFDYYDSSGNQINPKAAQSGGNESSSDGFFSRLWDRVAGKSEAPAKPTASPAKQRTVRKPLADNPYSMDTSAIAPASPAPQAAPLSDHELQDTPPAAGPDAAIAPLVNTPQPMPAAASVPSPDNGQPVEMPLPKEQPVEIPVPGHATPADAQTTPTVDVSAPPAADNAAPPAQETTTPPAAMPEQAPEQNVAPVPQKQLKEQPEGQWPRDRRGAMENDNHTALPTAHPANVSSTPWFGWLTGNDAKPAQAPDDSGMKLDVPKDQPYPSPASVPPTPQEFKAINSEKQQDLKELQQEQDRAQQERQQIDNEPSQQQPLTPVVVPPAPTPDQTNASAPSPAAAPEQPVELGHVSSGPPQEAQPQNAAPAVPEQATPDTAGTPAPQPVFNSPDVLAPVPDANAPAAPAAGNGAENITPAPEAIVPAPAAAPANENHAGSNAPDNGADAAPVPEAAVPETAPDQNAAPQGNALPSPDLLQNVQTLPPSRYRDREHLIEAPQPQ